MGSRLGPLGSACDPGLAGPSTAPGPFFLLSFPHELLATILSSGAWKFFKRLRRDVRSLTCLEEAEREAGADQGGS